MNLKVKCSVIVVALTVMTTAVWADAVFTLGNHPQPNEENIIFHNQQGTTIDGFTDRSDTLVQFSTLGQVLIGHGQDITGLRGNVINNITMTVPGHTFLDAILNPFKPGANGDLAVAVTLSDGITDTFTYGRKNGDNFLTITTSGGEQISSITISSAIGFLDLKQPRISGISGVTLTPEPGTLILMGSGLLGMAGVVRRKLGR